MSIPSGYEGRCLAVWRRGARGSGISSPPKQRGSAGGGWGFRVQAPLPNRGEPAGGCVGLGFLNRGEPAVWGVGVGFRLPS